MVFLKECPACRDSKHKQFRQYFDSHLVKCENCQLVFMNPRPKEDWINSYYENSPVYDLNREDNVWFGSPQERSLQLKYPESFNRYNKAILEEIEIYVRPGRMLDIGCSIGTLLRLARERGWKVSGLELAEDIAGFAHAEYDLEVYTSDLRQLSLERDSYDCITMIHVLEHLADLGSYLTEIYRLLRQGGILYIRTPNWHSLKYKLAGQYYFCMYQNTSRGFL